MKIRALIMVVVSLIAAGCLKYFVFWGRVIHVEDVTKDQAIVLSAPSSVRSVHSIRIVITGRIDGSAVIRRSYVDKDVYEPSNISGPVNLRLGGDWYSKECLLLYTPSEYVTTGELRIRYAFGAY